MFVTDNNWSHMIFFDGFVVQFLSTESLFVFFNQIRLVILNNF